MHILQRMYISVIISIDNSSCYLPSYDCWRGARTSDLQCHVEPSSYRWVTPKNIELILRLVDSKALVH